MGKEEMTSSQEYRAFIGKKRLILLVLFVFSLIAFLAAIALGSSNIAIDRVLATLIGSGEQKEKIIILNIRLPRAATAVIAGFGLGIVGCVMQGILHNPLASASTIGVSQGAAFGAAFAIIVLGGGLMSASSQGAQLSVSNPAMTTICAFIFSMVSTLFIVLLSRFRSMEAGTLLLSGVALSSLFSAGTTLLEYFSDDVRVAAVVYWTFGDLGSTFGKDIIIMAAVVIFATIYFVFNCWNYNAMQGGDNTAKGLGVNTRQILIMGMVVCSFTASTIVSYVGIINFVGLIAPHLVRKFVGTDYRFLLPASGLAGAILLLLSDTAARLVIAPIVLPIGAITSVLGAPMFLWIIYKGRWKR
ncbi:FecCD family ABC transporter permease [Butyrivibrio sp. INlla14]|uniref:FecCD family ABC transporter permease n=1 Tax=Butyrivibrio sp. INlla14 TaxID=1520808 RepID=UPI0008762E9D|nr:iron ABC transporter permease [Butyrivibrio sp. INlla14]SCX98904.1 iron complex transport system permease protein [Butyrivibrio sp. INlla14]